MEEGGGWIRVDWMEMDKKETQWIQDGWKIECEFDGTKTGWARNKRVGKRERMMEEFELGKMVGPMVYCFMELSQHCRCPATRST